MMRALADFIMRGRLQAGVVALFSVVVPLFPLGAVALVTLRHGTAEGMLMVLVGMIPAALYLMVDSSQNQVVFWGALLGLLMAYFPAAALRTSVSWQTALLVCLLAALLLVAQSTAFLPGLVAEFGQMAALFQGPAAAELAKGEPLPVPSTTVVSGFMAMAFWLNGVTALVLARWWQALLYNPGGFGEEFRALRLGKVVSLLCFVIAVLLYTQGEDYGLWATTFALPLVVAALAVVHTSAKRYGVSRIWLVALYGLLILASPILLLLAVLGLVDSWLNIRNRYLKIDKQ